MLKERKSRPGGFYRSIRRKREYREAAGRAEEEALTFWYSIFLNLI